MENARNLRQTLRRPKTDEEIFDRITPAKHSRSKSLLDVHSSRGVHQDREPSRGHDKGAQEHESRPLGSQHSESESDSDEPPLARSPQKLLMAPRTLQNQSDFSPISALSSAYMGCPLDDYSIDPFLDETWPEQLTQWDSSVNRHARFALDMESSSGDEKGEPRDEQISKPISWSTDLSPNEKMELIDKVGEKDKRQRDESEMRYLHRVMGHLRLTVKEKEHARQLLVARQDFDNQENEMLSHYRLEMHASFLKDPQATKKMTTEDKENLLEKHAGPVIAAAQAKKGVIDVEKIEAYWKQCGLDKKSWSQRDDAKNTASHPPRHRRKGSLGEDEFETYTKAFAAQKKNAARFEGKSLISKEKDPNLFRRHLDSESPDYLQHHYALGMGYTHVSQGSPPASSRLPHVRPPSPQPAASSLKPGGSSNDGSHQQLSNQSRQNTSTSARGASSHESHHQAPSNPPQQKKSTSTTRGASHHDHQHPKPTKTTTTVSSSSSLGPPRYGTVSGDHFAKAHLSLPQMPPGVDSIFSLKKKRDEMAEQEQRPRKVMKRMEEGEEEERGEKRKK